MALAAAIACSEEGSSFNSGLHQIYFNLQTGIMGVNISDLFILLTPPPPPLAVCQAASIVAIAIAAANPISTSLLIQA